MGIDFCCINRQFILKNPSQNKKKAISRARTVLESERNPQYAVDINHTYDDKYSLAELLANCTVAGMCVFCNLFVCLFVCLFLFFSSSIILCMYIPFYIFLDHGSKESKYTSQKDLQFFFFLFSFLPILNSLFINFGDYWFN